MMFIGDEICTSPNFAWWSFSFPWTVDQRNCLFAARLCALSPPSRTFQCCEN